MASSDLINTSMTVIELLVLGIACLQLLQIGRVVLLRNASFLKGGSGLLPLQVAQNAINPGPGRNIVAKRKSRISKVDTSFRDVGSVCKVGSTFVSSKCKEPVAKSVNYTSVHFNRSYLGNQLPG